MSKSFSKESYIFKVGDTLQSVKELVSGNVGLSGFVDWDKRNKCEFIFAHLKEDYLISPEYLFSNDKTALYSLKALNNVEIDEKYNNVKEVVDLDPAHSLVYLNKLIKTLSGMTHSFIELEKKYVLLHKMAVLSGVGILYCESQGFPTNNPYKDFTSTLQTFLKQKELNNKTFPLSQEVINYNYSEIRPESFSAIKNTLQFVRRLEAILPSFGQAILAKDAVFRNYLIEAMSLKISLFIESFKGLAENIFEMTRIILDKDGYLKIFNDVIDKTQKNPTAQKYLISLGSFIVKHLENNIFVNMSEFSPDFKDIVIDLLSGISDFDMSVVTSSGSDRSNFEAAPEQFKNSVSQILAYAELQGDSEFTGRFFENYNKWKAFDNPLSSDEEVRRVRNRVTQYYWDIYYHAFYQHKINNKPLTPVVELLFLFGFFDETLVDGKTIAQLYKRRANSYNNKPEIFTMYEWLSKIVDKSVNPSLDAMGETYEEMLRDLSRENENKNKTIEDLDKIESRLQFEINNLAKEAAKVCNSELGSYTPILVEDQVSGLDFGSFVSKEAISKAFRGILNFDFSAFYREIRYKENSIEEFIKKEILPVIILVPNVGKRGMVWQPKEKPKDSPGRLVLPHILTGSVQQILVSMFGLYRWEIVKEILGPLWNDISQLSITAEYTDYSSSIKKNKDLSEEAKEKVMTEFKKYRSDRERFANDYRKWVLLESQGRPGLNRVMRDFFFRQVPFPKALREQLRKMPAFAELADKYDNIVRREVNKLKLKYQRYTKSGENLPQALQEYLDFLLK